MTVTVAPPRPSSRAAVSPEIPAPTTIASEWFVSAGSVDRRSCWLDRASAGFRELFQTCDDRGAGQFHQSVNAAHKTQNRPADGTRRDCMGVTTGRIHQTAPQISRSFAKKKGVHEYTMSVATGSRCRGVWQQLPQIRFQPAFHAFAPCFGRLCCVTPAFLRSVRWNDGGPDQSVVDSTVRRHPKQSQRNRPPRVSSARGFITILWFRHRESAVISKQQRTHNPTRHE